MKKVEEKKQGISVWFPILFLIAVVPLMVFAKTYEHGLEGYAWYSDNTTTTDFFLYWKSRMIILSGAIALIVLGFTIFDQKVKKQTDKWNDNIKLFIPLGIYMLLALFSSFFAKNVDTAFWGSTEQFEGMLVILSYGIVCCYTFYFLSSLHDINFLLNGIMYGTGILSLIGACQFLGADFFSTSFAQSWMTMTEPALAGQTLKINFEGKSYATLYNPNYMGSYVPLLLPIVIVGALLMKKMWQKIVMAVIAVLLVMSLIGSESVTGYLAVIGIVVLYFIFMLPMLKRHLPVFLGSIGVFAVLVVLACVLKMDALEYGYNKIFHPKTNNYAVQEVKADGDKGLKITSHNNTIHVTFNDSAKEASDVFHVTDDKTGNALNMNYDSSNMSFTVADGAFKGFKLTPQTATIKSSPKIIFQLTDSTGKKWLFATDNGKYKFVSTYLKMDSIVDVKKFGFENSQHFASRRGYIWSRTIPLLGEHVVLGTGADSFVTTYPNNDYIGMTNNDYAGQIVTKPHNMYLQIGIQSGVVSLIAFLAFYIMYFIFSIRLYWNHLDGAWERMGLGILLGSFGYMIAGLANDSTITVAPIFWVMMGAGMAINFYIKKERKQKKNAEA